MADIYFSGLQKLVPSLGIGRSGTSKILQVLEGVVSTEGGPSLDTSQLLKSLIGLHMALIYVLWRALSSPGRCRAILQEAIVEHVRLSKGLVRILYFEGRSQPFQMLFLVVAFCGCI